MCYLWTRVWWYHFSEVEIHSWKVRPETSSRRRRRRRRNNSVRNPLETIENVFLRTTSKIVFLFVFSGFCHGDMVHPLGYQESSRVSDDCTVDHITDLFHTTHRTRTQQVPRNRGQTCGDIDLTVYLANVVGPLSLVLDIRITHDSECHMSV